MKTLYVDETGPLLRYSGDAGMFFVDDLNPQITTKWRLSRWELFVIGCKAIWAAIS